MLNGPTDYNKHNYLKCTNWKTFPKGHIYSNKGDCSNCCQCPKNPIVACECDCNCLANDFEYPEIDFDYKSLPKFEEGSIKILYREKIKVFYDSVREAEKDGYHDFSKKDYPK
jgi:hypothetical protein